MDFISERVPLCAAAWSVLEVLFLALANAALPASVHKAQHLAQAPITSPVPIVWDSGITGTQEIGSLLSLAGWAALNGSTSISSVISALIMHAFG